MGQGKGVDAAPSRWSEHPKASGFSVELGFAAG